MKLLGIDNGNIKAVEVEYEITSILVTAELPNEITGKPKLILVKNNTGVQLYFFDGTNTTEFLLL